MPTAKPALRPPMKPIPAPGIDDFGHGARRWLESKGLVARQPSIRSSDLAIECDFLYYLHRRLSLVPMFSISRALSHGDWFHVALETIMTDPLKARPALESRLSARVDELRGYAKAIALGAAETESLCAQAKHDALTAWSWYLSSQHFNIPGHPMLSSGWRAYLLQPHWKLLGRELCLKRPHESGVDLVVQLDQLWYNSKTDKLWAFDAKTTARSPVQRSTTLQREFQPPHYLSVIRDSLDDLRAHFDLPASTQLGGMLHLLLKKPSIRFGDPDRPYGYIGESKRTQLRGACSRWKSGWLLQVFAPQTTAPQLKKEIPNEEEVREAFKEAVGVYPEKAYTGEPSTDLYAARCRHWYKGTGDSAPHPQDDPPVNVSTTSAAILEDPRVARNYGHALQRAVGRATRAPLPENFPEHPSGLEDRFSNEPSAYAAFYLTPVRDWPDLVARHRLIQKDRDETLSFPLD